MKTTLQQLKEIDPSLIVEGKRVYLHTEVEYISWFNTKLTDSEWKEYEDEFNTDPLTFMYGCSNEENEGIITCNHFPELIDTTLEQFESVDNTPTDGVVIDVWRVISSLFPVVVEFPTDDINNDECYSVGVSVDSDGEFEDIESYETNHKVWR